MRKEDKDKVVARAMELIGPTAKRKDVELAVRFGMGFVKREGNYEKSGKYGVFTGDQKEAAGEVAVALRRLMDVVAKTPAVAKTPWFPLDEDEIESWQRHAQAAAKKKLKPPIRRDPGKDAAAKLAGQLLRKHKLPLTHRNYVCLAAVLYGDEDKDLRRQCAAYRRVAGLK